MGYVNRPVIPAKSCPERWYSTSGRWSRSRSRSRHAMFRPRGRGPRLYTADLPFVDDRPVRSVCCRHLLIILHDSAIMKAHYNWFGRGRSLRVAIAITCQVWL